MASDKLNQAVALIRAGNKAAAVPILKEAIRANPQDENAWLWLYACVDEVEQKKVCLQKALEINPGNLRAHVALGKLTELAARPVQPAAKKKPGANQNTRNRLFVFGGLGLLLCLCLGTSLFLVQTDQFAALGASLPFFPTSTLTPSSTPTVTATATPSPSPTITETVTPLPSSTLTPSPTATLGAAGIAPMEALESYRLRGKMALTGGFGGNSATPFTLSFTREWVKASLAQHTTLSIQGTPPTISGKVTPGQFPAMDMDVITIDKTTWIKSENHWARIDSQKSLALQNSVASPVSDWQNLQPSGVEIIHGISCQHYTVDEDTMKMTGLGSQSITMHTQGDIWVANQPDLPSVPLRMKIQIRVSGFFSSPMTATPDPRMEVVTQAPQAANDKDMVYDYEYEVTDVNTAITIELPKTSTGP